MKQSHQLFNNCPFENENLKIISSENNIGKETKKEGFNVDLSDQLKNLMDGFQYFGIGYELAKNIYTEQSLTIHQEKAKCKKAVDGNSFLQTAVNYLLNVVWGDKPGIFSKNESLTLYASRWLYFSRYKKEVKKAIKQAIMSGDGYIQKIKGSFGNIKYRNIENAEDMYIEYDYKTMTIKRYIERLYYTEAECKKLGIKTYTLYMPWGVETIEGIEYSPDEIIHLQFLEHRFGMGYGRSPLASVLNDVEIINKMERSVAVIAMYKAIPKKIIFPDSNKPEETLDTKRLQPIIDTLGQMKDYESPVIGTKLSSINLTDGGQALDLTPYLDYFKRKISMVLSPEFIVHGELVNRSTSVEEKQLFYLSVCSIRDEFYDVIQEEVLVGVTGSLNLIKDKTDVPTGDITWEFGDYDVELRDAKNIRLMNEWNSSLITQNEYREEIGYTKDENGNLYKGDLFGSSSDQVIEELKKVIK